MEESTGLVQTVLGPVDATNLGVTLTHEHLSMTYISCHVPATHGDVSFERAPFTLENVGWIRQNPYSHVNNLILNDSEAKEAIFEEMKRFKAFGGTTIVENTVHGLKRDVQFLKELSMRTGVNIIAGTGYYVAASQPRSALTISGEEIANLMTNELVVGCQGTDICCGIIGEIGCSWPLEDFEKTVLRAAAHVQSQHECPVMIHPGRNEKSPFEIMRLFLEAGGNAKKTVMAHLDRTLHDDRLLEFASLGTFCEFDLFGTETSHYQFNESIDMPSDAQRIGLVKNLVCAGFEDQIVLAHDIHTKHRLTKYGGHGFAHILQNVVPKMKSRGLDQSLIDKFLIHNPRKWLSSK